MLGEHAFREVHPERERRLPPGVGLGVGAWAFLVPALGLWIWGTLRHAARTRTAPSQRERPRAASPELGPRHGFVLLLVVIAFAGLVRK